MTKPGEEQDSEQSTAPIIETSSEVIDDEVADTPYWMQEEELDSSEELGGDGEDEEEHTEKGKTVPVAKHIDIKRKLKGKLSEQSDELERLRKENELLRSGTPKQEVQNFQAPKRPRIDEYDTTAEYEDAIDAYEEAKDRYREYVSTHQTVQRQQQEQREQIVNKAVDEHVDRATKLILDYKIDPDVYTAAQDNVKRIIKDAKIGNAELIFNDLTAKIGVGSEKVWFHLGRNKTASAEFERLLQEDPSGIKLAMYLGEKKVLANGTKNQSSRAPQPGKTLKGDEQLPANAKAFQRKWAEAHGKKRVQEAFDIKRQAKAKGIDTSKW